jgi:AcrR family transcriptional regulator
MEGKKKECILVEAAKCFARFGFKKASVDEIAKQAGVGKGTVYLAADSKEDLYYQVLHREMRAWIAECSQVLDHRKPADKLLAELLGIAMGHLERHPLLCELLFGSTEKTMPEWRDRFVELRALGRANLIEILRLGIRQGVFRKDLEVETVAALLQDFHLSAYLPHHEGDAQSDVAERARVGLDLVLNGLRVHDHHRHALAT